MTSANDKRPSAASPSIGPAASGPDFDSGPIGEVLRARGLIGTGPLTIERLAGGQSNPTYRLGDGDTRLVLRKKPPGPLLPSAHAIDREYRVLSALKGSDVPVPEVLMYSDDSAIIGTPFYLMAFLDGRVWIDQSLPGLDPDERRAIFFEMNRVIAALHQVDVDAVGLADYGKAGNYFGRQIGRWSRQAAESRYEDIPALDALMAWLPDRIPADDRTSLVHGDYRLDNLVFAHDEPRAIGLLDWELSTLGHPLADFAYNCLSWHIPSALWRGVADLDLEALGLPDETSYVRRYVELTGNAIAPGDWSFYIAYNLFRLAAITQGVGRRALDGNASAPDAARTGALTRPLADLGWAYARRHEQASGRG